MNADLAAALASFHILSRDYERLLEFIHPSASNATTYSHRTYELLLRACTEFESLAKIASTQLGITLPRDEPSIQDLSSLYEILDLAAIDVCVAPWTPEPILLKPLEQWNKKPHGLGWYRAYNRVKHNRVSAFPEASLLNTTYALAACFALLVRLGAIVINVQSHIHVPNNRVQFKFPDLPVFIEVPETWKLINGGY